MCLHAADARGEWLRFASAVAQAEFGLDQAQARRLALILFEGPETLGAELHTWSRKGPVTP